MAGFTQEVLNKAAVKQRRAKEKRKVAAQVGGGVRTHQIDSVLFHQGVAYGRKHGMDNAWNDPGFVQEMEKCHPDIVVDGGSAGCSPVSAYMLEQAKKLVGG